MLCWHSLQPVEGNSVRRNVLKPIISKAFAELSVNRWESARATHEQLAGCLAARVGSVSGMMHLS
jgi:hypothetical protein